jgi:hypothetical protein
MKHTIRGMCTIEPFNKHFWTNLPTAETDPEGSQQQSTTTLRTDFTKAGQIQNRNLLTNP